jgi:hypothetical protein
MLKGFEKETADLTADEMKIIPMLVTTLKYTVGAKAAITNKNLRSWLASCTDEKQKPIIVSDSRIRKMINYIRMHDLVPGLIATSKGYYVSENPKEIKDYIESLKGREDSIRGIRIRTQIYYNKIIPPYQSQLNF